MRGLTTFLFWLWLGVAQAAVELHRFSDPQQEGQYKQLISELRCLVCQNQNIADSNADLAKDLRQQVYEMVQAGKSDEEIVDFMVARYGDFVLYNPPLKAKTVLLWVGPFLILAGGVVFLFRAVVRRRHSPASGPSEEERARIREILEGSDRDS